MSEFICSDIRKKEITNESSMFCSEPVIWVYNGEERWPEKHPGGDGFLDFCHGITYHVTEGYRIVLETEHHYISLSANGVAMTDKIGPFTTCELREEALDPCIHADASDPEDHPFVEYEQTLFAGERLLRVSSENGFALLFFDDFTMRIDPHRSGMGIPRPRGEICRYAYGCERLLRKACSCGGTGELMVDPRFDFFVRCKKCRQATWAEMIAQDAINEWNAGELNWDASDIRIG